MMSFILNRSAIFALMMAIMVGNHCVVQSLQYAAPKDTRRILNVAHEDLDTDSIFKVTASAKSRASENSNGQEYHVEFNAFGEDHKVQLRTHHDDPELASVFGDKYGIYSMVEDKKTGEKRFVKSDDSLGDADSIKNCVYKGQRDDGAIAVYVACKGSDYLLISNVGGDDDEEIIVKKDKQSGKMKASKTKFSKLKHNADGIPVPKPKQSKDGDRRQLVENECATSPQKYLSLVVVNSISRVNAFNSVFEMESNTIAEIIAGKVWYDRMTTPLGCNVKVRLAGQLYDTPDNKIIGEPFCNEVDVYLSEVQTSHNANNGPNGCCSKFPIVWENCNVGETKCWNANSPKDPKSWRTAAPPPVPGVDFTKDGGCFNTIIFESFTSNDDTKTVSYYGLDKPYLASNSPDQVSHGMFLDNTSRFFKDNAASLRSTFGDVDNVEAWTMNDWHSNVVGLAWVGTLCNDYYSTAIIISKYGPGVWAHEMGHNLGMDHQKNGIMGRRLGEKRNLLEYFAPESEADFENFLVNSYGVDGGVRCLENDVGTKVPTPKPTLRPDFIPTQSPTSGYDGKCNPYICGGSNCGPGLACHSDGYCYDWGGADAYMSCKKKTCNEGLSCHPETLICTPCSTTPSPTFVYIPGGGVGDKCDPNACGGSTCDPKLTCDSDGVCRVAGKVPVGGICRADYCQAGLTCNRVTDICMNCSPTKSPTIFDACAKYTSKGKCKKVSGCKWIAATKTCVTSA